MISASLASPERSSPISGLRKFLAVTRRRDQHIAWPEPHPEFELVLAVRRLHRRRCSMKTSPFLMIHTTSLPRKLSSRSRQPRSRTATPNTYSVSASDMRPKSSATIPNADSKVRPSSVTRSRRRMASFDVVRRSQAAAASRRQLPQMDPRRQVASSLSAETATEDWHPRPRSGSPSSQSQRRMRGCAKHLNRIGAPLARQIQLSLTKCDFTYKMIDDLRQHYCRELPMTKQANEKTSFT